MPDPLDKVQMTPGQWRTIEEAKKQYGAATERADSLRERLDTVWEQKKAAEARVRELEAENDTLRTRLETARALQGWRDD